MMMEGEANNSRRKKKRAVPYDYGFTDTVFSWSLEDIFNENLFKDKVKQIPFSFRSVGQYFESFVFPLLEETRANLMSGMENISNAPFAKVVAFEDSQPHGSTLYDVKVDRWKKRFSNLGKEPYKTLPGDILVLADAKPETASDLQRVGRMWTFVSVANVTEDENEIDTSSTYFKVNATKEIQIDVSQKSLFVIFLTNRTSNRRIWNSLHMKGNLKIIKELLCTDSGVDETCELCPMQSEGVWNETFGHSLSSTLDDSQVQAVLSCLRQMHCDHKATVQLIWGPPGTGKTKTVSMLLVILLQMKFRTLVCTPTNVAIKELASRVVKLVKESVERDCRDALFFPLGDILLLGNNERLKVDSGVEEIYLDYRVKRLADCFAPLTGWSHCFASMVDFLDNCVSLYHTSIKNESMKQSEDINGDIIKEKECGKEADVSDVEIKPFLEFVRDRFKCIAAPLRSCIFNFCTHIPKCYIGEDNFHVMATLISLLDSFETLLFENNLVSEELEELLSHSVDEGLSKSIVGIKYLLHERRSECHFVLRKLQSSFNELNLPSAVEKDLLEDLLKRFCLKRASLFLSTASCSYMLQSVAMEPLNFLVIDEAAQLKESESTIPLQLSGIKHAVLFGDECQLPAMVESKVSAEACFGRSLFERLSYLGYSKHLLSIQYRMHPSISCFPNSYFYENKILDSSTVRKRSYEKRFLHGPMYGPYSFINVFGGREEFIEHSCRNMVEVSVVMKILLNLYKATSNVVRFKNLADNDNNSGSDLSGAAFDSRNYAENSNVSESLSLMKFYRLSVVVSHLLSDRVGRELDLPFEVTDEQLEMILSPRSTFILGRSGTGKTTVLTRKLFQKEELHRMAMEEFYGVNNSVTLHCSQESEAEEGLGETERPILRQLFVTVSPKLYIPAESYPLVITFHKFLMMLDGTLGSSYFDRFHDIRKHYGQVRNSSLLFLQTFIRTKEVNFERFCSSYWPRFNTQLTKKLDPSRVFTEIISHIRGGLQSIDVADGKLCREEYIRLSETRVSTLLRSEREKIYEIYENYEQMKMRNGEFDLADLVNDLHRRFKEERYKGDEFHFVYIDEVQDLTMSQIALFKYVCRNIEEGFVFSGDTAQTIARGIDFRFQDIRSLFYKKFVLESRNTRNVGRQEKGQLSNIFNLSQNFRTHAGVLNLAQSVIELLYRFFPHSVDILKPETSLIYGEPPVLLESRDDENAVIKIFGNSGDAGGNMVGFGAEQVILEQALFDSTLPGSFPSFNEAKHNLLCSELKQLYVAITRTRQRLWIWENMEEFSKPMFDYWKKRSKASGLKAAADRISSSNLLEANVFLREAAKIFEAIGKADSAAKCFCDLGECEEPELEKAGECFFLAGCYKLAADVYARGSFLAECLDACSKGKLFDIGLQYISYWKQHADADVGRVKSSKRIKKIEQDFLQSCALHFHKLNDNKSMMKFVRAFHSMDLIRNFLNSNGCFDELLMLEEEFGNFMDAANIARLRGDILRTADLLQKAGNHKEACYLTLNYVLSNSLWSAGSKGWPLKQFTQKKELLEKAKLLAKSESNKFYKFVCTEAYILSNDQSDLLIMNQQLNASKRHQSVNGETLSARKILDFHLHTNSSEYVWEDELVLDETNCNKRVSVQTLIYFWNCWKDKIVNVLKYLECLKSQDFNDYRSYGDFCLNYLGVWRQYNNGNIIYLLLNSDAEWVRDLDNRHALRSGKLASINVHQLVSAGRNYWSSELLSIGMKVLDNLEALHKQSSKNSPSVWCHVLCPAYMYEVAKFLLSSNYPSLQYHAKVLQKFVDQSMEHFVDSIFPLEWQESLNKNMISLKGTELYRNIIREVVYKHIGLKGNLSYGQIGNAVVMILRNGKLGNDVYGRVAKRFDGNTPWKEFVESLSFDMGLESCRGSALHNHDDMKEVSHVWKFYRALCDTYEANWRRADYITPDCFLYLIERLLILLSSFKGCIFTTKSSFVDWLIYQEWSTNPTCSLFTDLHQLFGVVHEFIFNIVQQFLYNEKETMEWIKKSCTEIKDYHSLVVLRLVVIVCLLHLNFGNSLNLLVDLLGQC
ncbi:hypothetical protein WN943_025576 [Citrus x changshan-huyou]